MCINDHDTKTELIVWFNIRLLSNAIITWKKCCCFSTQSRMQWICILAAVFYNSPYYCRVGCNWAEECWFKAFSIYIKRKVHLESSTYADIVHHSSIGSSTLSLHQSMFVPSCIDELSYSETYASQIIYIYTHIYIYIYRTTHTQKAY